MGTEICNLILKLNVGIREMPSESITEAIMTEASDMISTISSAMEDQRSFKDPLELTDRLSILRLGRIRLLQLRICAAHAALFTNELRLIKGQ